VHARDGDIGKVREFLFDDLIWTVRYLVVDTGNWLIDQLVLVSPKSLNQPNWDSQTLPVNLSKEQVENSPPISEDEPVSRQKESELHSYYGWPPYWRMIPGMTGPTAVPTVPPVVQEGLEKEGSEEGESDDSHLRSTREVIGYHIQATDGDIGHVSDFILDDEIWQIRYLVVDTGNWLPGRRVLISPAWIDDVSWREKSVVVNLSQESIKHSPEYNPAEPVNREYEVRLYDFYGRPKYWIK
jgi:hypothetical protein